MEERAPKGANADAGSPPGTANLLRIGCSSRFRLAPVAVCVLAIGLAASACGSTQSPAFEVNGQATSQSDFDRELDALADNEQFAELYGQPVRNSEGTVSADLAAAWATIVIQQEILADAVADEDIEITDEDREAAETSASDLFGGAEGGSDVFGEFPEWFRDRIVDRLAAQEAHLRASDATPSEEEVRAFYDENVALLVDQCPSGKFVSHILVETAEEADEIVADLDGGASFPELAGERSTDTGSGAAGGFLDCFQEGAYVPEFEAAVAAAPVDTTTAPVQSEFGWHVIRIEAQPSFEALRGQIEESIAGTAQQETYTQLVEEADVEVDPRYGTWVVDEQGGRVQPPEAAVEETPELPEDVPEIEVPELDEPPPST